MYERTSEALLEAERDQGVAAVVFSANGSAYCAGNDLDDF
jgi:enoyl-CoA hydratase/carnithine racemase